MEAFFSIMLYLWLFQIVVGLVVAVAVLIQDSDLKESDFMDSSDFKFMPPLSLPSVADVIIEIIEIAIRVWIAWILIGLVVGFINGFIIL